MSISADMRKDAVAAFAIGDGQRDLPLAQQVRLAREEAFGSAPNR